MFQQQLEIPIKGCTNEHEMSCECKTGEKPDKVKQIVPPRNKN